MGFLSRFFGKKDDEFDKDLMELDKDIPDLGSSLPKDNLGLEEGSPIPETPSAPETEFSSPSGLQTERHRLAPETASVPSPPTLAGTSQRDLELINSKLDTLKAILNSMDQRIANLEKAAGVEQNKKMPW